MKSIPSNIGRKFQASCLFLGGGIITWILLSSLYEFGASQAGLSAGSVAGSSLSNKFIIYLLCAYFFIGAACSLFLVRKADLKIAAALSHLLVMIALCFICYQGSNDGLENFIQSALILIFITGIYLLPWLILWAKIIKAGTSVTCNTLPSQEKSQREKVDKIKLKY